MQPPAPSLLPADHATRFVEARACRSSAEHPVYMRVLTEPAARAQYLDGPFPLPVGTLIVKEEFLERGCTTPLAITLMRKEPAGYDPTYGDWHWQRLDVDKRVLDDGKGAGPTHKCASCHAKPACRDFTCVEP